MSEETIVHFVSPEDCENLKQLFGAEYWPILLELHGPSDQELEAIESRQELLAELRLAWEVLGGK